MPINKTLFLAALLSFTSFWCPLALADTGYAPYTSFLGFTLDTLPVTLLSVVSELGSSPIITTSEGGDVEVSLCYQVDENYIRFLSSEMGGENHDLLGFELSHTHPRQDCPALQGLNQPLEIGGLHLDMTRKEFLEIFAKVKSIRQEHQIITVTFSDKKMMTDEEKLSLAPDAGDSPLPQDYFDITVTITGTFVHNRLASFSVWKIESL